MFLFLRCQHGFLGFIDEKPAFFQKILIIRFTVKIARENYG
jgi:hypothetical protein